MCQTYSFLQLQPGASATAVVLIKRSQGPLPAGTRLYTWQVLDSQAVQYGQWAVTLSGWEHNQVWHPTGHALQTSVV